MRLSFLIVAVAGLAVLPGSLRAEDTEATKLRKEMERLRKDMQAQIDDLTARKNAAEDRAIDEARRSEQKLRDMSDKLDAAWKAQTRAERELKLAEAKIEELEAKVRRLPPEPLPDVDSDAALRRALEAQNLNVNFRETPLEEAIKFFQDLTGKNFVSLATDGARKITFKLEESTVAKVLDKVVATLGDLEWKIEHGVITFVPSKAPPSPVTLDLPEKYRAALARRVSATFDDSGLDRVADRLIELGLEGLTVAAEAKAKEIKVTCRLREAPLRQFLELMCRKHGLLVRETDGRLVLGLK